MTVVWHTAKHSWLPLVSLALVVGCSANGGRGLATIPRESSQAAPAAVTADPTIDSLQKTFESGRYQDVLDSLRGTTPSPEGFWFGAHSSLRLGQRDEAIRLFTELMTVDAVPGWRTVSDLALAQIHEDPDALDYLRASINGVFVSHPFVQFELGMAHAQRGDFTEAAAAFDRSADVNPRFAYAYYNAALMYDQLGRADLMVGRLETFVRLAPDAPERQQVQSILTTARRK
jgi:tetratricopeptide (TPR) repeat protein